MNNYAKILRRCFLSLLAIVALLALGLSTFGAGLSAQGVSSDARPVMIATIDGTINPAADNYLRAAIAKAAASNAQLLILKLNTPGGLLTSMQTMVEQLLESPVPTVVYVSPSGGGAISAGVFITLAGNFAVMAPGTNIGAAHPVMGGGQDVKGHMGEKVENFAASLAKAIAEQRKRNVTWAEKSVRESVAITDREAVELKVVDFVASDIPYILEKLEGKTLTVKGATVTLSGLRQASQQEIAWSFKQKLINILSDPNIAILLGLAAIAGIGIELYHPGLVVPGVVGVVCLILSLTAGQVLPISQGGLALLLVGAGLFAVEFFMPAFGIWGIAGTICFVLGAIYFVDTDMVWSTGAFTVNRVLVGSVAGLLGATFLGLSYLVLQVRGRAVTTGKEGLLGKVATVTADFAVEPGQGESSAQWYSGRVTILGENWKARIEVLENDPAPRRPEKVEVTAVEGLVLLVRRISN